MQLKLFYVLNHFQSSIIASISDFKDQANACIKVI